MIEFKRKKQRMNIVVDNGNSRAKVALFDKNELLQRFDFDALPEVTLRRLIEEYKPHAGIISSVGKLDPLAQAFLYQSVPCFYELKNQSLSLPLIIDYQTPETLGADRIAAAIGAYTQKRGSNLLVIDIGTAITIDYVEKKGVYKGGNISPGIALRFNALNTYTDKLPLVNENGDLPAFGYNTQTAVRAGVINGIIRELDSYINEYKKKGDVFTFLTGGHSFYFESKLKNSIFADGNLVLKGLNEILNYQHG